MNDALEMNVIRLYKKKWSKVSIASALGIHIGKVRDILKQKQVLNNPRVSPYDRRWIDG
jgi:hypothetical protein